MKTLLTFVISCMMPAMCIAQQQYQFATPMQQMNNYRLARNYQEAQSVLPQMQQPQAAPSANFSSPMAQQVPAPVANMGGATINPMACDAGGCDSSGFGNYFGGCGNDGGFGFESCGSDACGSGCCGGTYFTVLGGATEMDPQTSTGIGRDLQIDFSQGYALGGAVGRRVGRNLRMELEYVFRSQTPDQVQFNGNFPGNESGFQNSHAGMLNFTYDLVFGRGTMVPYIGGGIGVASIDSKVRYGSSVAALDGDDSSIAYQWMAGLSYRARPNMEMFIEYRFFEIDDPKLNRFGGPSASSGSAFHLIPNVILESEYISQDIMAGIRFNF